MIKISFELPGIKPEDVWQLFNVSNFRYYLLKVRDLLEGKCPFCQIDTTVNKVLFENRSWLVWKNDVAPRSGQKFQLIVPSKRHITAVHEMDYEELVDLKQILDWIQKEFNIPGGVIVIRSGDAQFNAKSVDHLHINYQVPTGLDRVEVTIAKSPEDLEKKLPILQVFEKMRLSGKTREMTDEELMEGLRPEEKTLVETKLGKQK